MSFKKQKVSVAANWTHKERNYTFLKAKSFQILLVYHLPLYFASTHVLYNAVYLFHVTDMQIIHGWGNLLQQGERDV